MPNSILPKQLISWNDQQPAPSRKERLISFVVEIASWTAAAIVFFLVFKFISSLF